MAWPSLTFRACYTVNVFRMDSGCGKTTCSLSPGGHSVADRLTALKAETLGLSPSSPCADSATLSVSNAAALKKKTSPQLVRPVPGLQINREDTDALRIVCQYLRDIGLKESANLIVEESGIKMECSFAPRLRAAVMGNCWCEVLDILEAAERDGIISNDVVNRLSPMIHEQRFLDHILIGQGELALIMLRRGELAHLQANFREEPGRMRAMLALLLMPREDQLKTYELRQYKKQVYREAIILEIEEALPSRLMVPSKRLRRIFEQAKLYQGTDCVCVNENQSPNVNKEETYLMRDHTCLGSSIQHYHEALVMREHKVEVTCMEFSHDGIFLATAAKANNIRITKFSSDFSEFALHRQLSTRKCLPTVKKMSWSSNNQFLAVAAPFADKQEIYVFDVPLGTIYRMIRNASSQHYMSTCVFTRTPLPMLACADEYGNILVHEIRTMKMHARWEGYRIREMFPIHHGNGVIALDTHNRVRQYEWDPRGDRTLVQESAPVISFSLHQTKRIAALSLHSGIRIWHLDDRCVMRNLHGVAHDSVIRSDFCYGNPLYFASGTKDGRVLVWNLDESRPVLSISAHSKTVNAVAWHPANKRVIVSCSDDMAVKVWHLGCEPFLGRCELGTAGNTNTAVCQSLPSSRCGTPEQGGSGSCAIFSATSDGFRVLGTKTLISMFPRRISISAGCPSRSSSVSLD